MSGNPGYTTPQQGQRHNPTRDDSWVHSLTLISGQWYPTDNENNNSNPPLSQPRSNAASASMGPPARPSHSTQPLGQVLFPAHSAYVANNDMDNNAPSTGEFQDYPPLGQLRHDLAPDPQREIAEFFRDNRSQRYAGNQNDQGIVESLDRKVQRHRADLNALQPRAKEMEKDFSRHRGKIPEFGDLEKEIDDFRTSSKDLERTLELYRDRFSPYPAFGTTEYKWMMDCYNKVYEDFQNKIRLPSTNRKKGMNADKKKVERLQHSR